MTRCTLNGTDLGLMVHCNKEFITPSVFSSLTCQTMIKLTKLQLKHIISTKVAFSVLLHE